MPSTLTPANNTLPDGAAVSYLTDGDAVNSDNLYKELSPGGTKKLTLKLVADWATSLWKDKYNPGTARVVRSPMVNGSGGAWAYNAIVQTSSTVDQILDLPDGATLTNVTIWVDPVNATPPAGTPLRWEIAKLELSTGTATAIMAITTDTTAGAGYGARHSLSSGTLSEVIDNSTYIYIVEVLGEMSTGAANVVWNGTKVTY